jgi:catechol 2,3-dioxygenase-like lactoylglutathione lyase family enzyme
MSQPIQATAIHHITLTVSDVQRSQAFYEAVLGFHKIADYGPRAVMAKGRYPVSIPNPVTAEAGPGGGYGPVCGTAGHNYWYPVDHGGQIRYVAGSCLIGANPPPGTGW